jgi:hypothetical protein
MHSACLKGANNRHAQLFDHFVGATLKIGDATSPTFDQHEEDQLARLRQLHVR